jgi:hypothetical protein
MKKTIWLAMAAVMATVFANAQNKSVCTAAAAQDGDFTIRGEITGLVAGDTLRFERIELPDWAVSRAFDVVVETPDKFEYTGRQPHAEYYMMTYIPAKGKAPESSKRGLTMIVDGGTVSVNGIADEIYYSRVDGEAFGEQPLLKEATEIENATMMERSRYLRQANEAFAARDSVKGREYIQQFNAFRGDMEKMKRANELKSEFLRNNPSSPWSLVQRLERSSNTPVDTLEVYYASLEPTARTGYFGSLLRKTIDLMARLQPGQPTPDFRVTLPDGRIMNSADFRGKYLLIYHWGFCPGSLQLEAEATNMYNRFKDNLNILGITPSLDAIRSSAKSTAPDAEMFGIKLKPTFESMAAHPWIDVEYGVGENDRLHDAFAFSGFPFFVLISPDGKIVSRGFHKTFFETKTILETK